MVAANFSPARRLRRGTKTEDYLDALASTSRFSDRDSNGDDDTSTGSEAAARISDERDVEDNQQLHHGPIRLSSIDSPFQVQEYISLLVAQDPHNIQRLVALPSFGKSGRNSATSTTRTTGKGKGPETKKDQDQARTKAESQQRPGGDNVQGESVEEGTEDTDDQDDNEDDDTALDRDVWLYEHLRRIAMDLSHPFVVALQEHCTRATCPEMKAGEWLYLCAAHASANETECCAIDYITHTLDGATALLNSSRYFPSRISIPQTSLKHFTSISRRLYRIFAHAWYQHREIFDMCEAETSLYERFLALSKEYDLVSPDLIVIPSQKEQSQLNGRTQGHEEEEEGVRGKVSEPETKEEEEIVPKGEEGEEGPVEDESAGEEPSS